MVENVRPARAALKVWLAPAKGQTQARLARAIGRSQQFISDLLQGDGPAPDEATAMLIDTVTKGKVRHDDWATREELDAFAVALERARAFARTGGEAERSLDGLRKRGASKRIRGAK